MKSILVIEDDRAILENTTEMLELEGYHVFSAINGRDGFQKAREVNPNLILCDIGMPIMNGWEVLEALRKDLLIGETPFIFFTAFSEKPQMRKGMEMGANGYIIKPFFNEELLQKIEEILQHPSRNK